MMDVNKSSAFTEVQTVKVNNGKPIPTLARNWDYGLRKIEKTGTPAPKFTPDALSALHDFVFSIPKDTVVSIGNGSTHERHQITPSTQRSVQQAATHFPPQPRTEYVSKGSIRGRLAVLASWNPEERSFRLQLPLAPARPVKCTYRDTNLVSYLREAFERMMEINGH